MGWQALNTVTASLFGADSLPAAEYMKSVLRIPEEQVPALCTECYATYGTTMAGLEVRQHVLGDGTAPPSAHTGLTPEG